VKRSSDTRIRREVVGQMLDYAANGVRYWEEGTLRQLFERTCADAGRDPGIGLEEVIGPEADAEEFWARAGRNLRGGALRLVFVADVIPDVTAAAEMARRPGTSLDDRLESAGTEVSAVAERLRILAADAGLSVVPAANSLRLTDHLGAVVLLYPTYRSLEFPWLPWRGTVVKRRSVNCETRCSKSPETPGR
jgi:hypothetical protein